MVFTESFLAIFVILMIVAAIGVLCCVTSLVLDWKKIKFAKPWNGPTERPRTSLSPLKLRDVNEVVRLPLTPSPMSQRSHSLVPVTSPLDVTPSKTQSNSNNNVKNKSEKSKTNTLSVPKNKTAPNNSTAVSKDKVAGKSIAASKTFTTSQQQKDSQQRANPPVPDVNDRSKLDRELERCLETLEKKQRRQKSNRLSESVKRAIDPPSRVASARQRGSQRVLSASKHIKAILRSRPSSVSSSMDTLISDSTQSTPTSQRSLKASIGPGSARNTDDTQQESHTGNNSVSEPTTQHRLL